MNKLSIRITKVAYQIEELTMNLQGKHILIFEDNASNIAVIAGILEDEGASISLWLGGSKDDLLDLAPIDLILLDLMYPGDVSGFDIFQKLRSWHELENTPIAAVSAMDASVGIPRTQELGFSAFISKPVDIDLFPQQVRAIINGFQIWN